MVDVRKGNVVSDQPVELEMLQGTLNANRLEIVDSGDLVRFHGGVDMMMMLNDTALPKPKSERAMTAIRRLSLRLLIAAALSVSGRGSARAAGIERAAERAAGFFAEPRPAGAYRGGDAGSARQGQGGDLQRQCESDAGRHRHALQVAAGVLRSGRRRRRQGQQPAGGRRPVPAASRRSSGWKRAAAWW